MDTNTDQINNSDNTNSNQPDEDQGDSAQSTENSTPSEMESSSEPQESSSDSGMDSATENPKPSPQAEDSSDKEPEQPPVDSGDIGSEDAKPDGVETPAESPVIEETKPEEASDDSGDANVPSSESSKPPEAEAPTPETPTPVEPVQPDQTPAQDQVPSPEVAPPAPVVPEDTPQVTASADTPKDKSKKSKKMPMVLLIIFIVCLAAIAAGGYMYNKHHHSAPKTATSFKVGLMMAFSGGSSAMGFGTSKGVALAKKQLNADNISVVEADSQCDPIAAVKAINSLIKQHVVAIIGDGCSSASLAALPIANNAQIPMISPSASSTKLSIPNDYFYRVIPNDNHQGAYMAQTVYNDGIRRAAVFYTNEPYGASIEQAFQNSFESLGGKVVATAFSQPNVIDLSSQINTLKAANPQAIFFAPNSVTTGIAAVKLARQAGITVPFYGADVFYDQTIISNAESDVEGMKFTTFPTGTTAFKQALANAYPNASQLYAAPEAYDAFKAIFLAIQRGATTGPEIKNALPSIKFQGVSSYISFDQNGDLATNGGYQYALFQVKNGQFVQLN